MIRVNYTELDSVDAPTLRLEARGHAGYAPAGQAQYNALLNELAVWLRQRYPSASRVQWRW